LRKSSDAFVAGEIRMIETRDILEQKIQQFADQLVAADQRPGVLPGVSTGFTHKAAITTTSS
jgi:hypothetical protein